MNFEDIFARDAGRILKHKSQGRNRVRVAIAHIRARITHAVDQKKVEPDVPESVSASYKADAIAHAQMRMSIWKGYEMELLSREEYETAREILGETSEAFDKHDLPTRLAISAVIAGLQTKARL